MMSAPTASDGGLFIGIDGGGTHTRAALVRADGTVAGIGMGGPSNFQTVGIATTRRSVLDAVTEAYRSASMEKREADALFLGMAGVASARDRETIEEMGRSLAIAARVRADHDIRTALAGGLAGEPGIALIAGTGSAAYGRSREGRAWRSGGWGHILDDLGGGYWIGVQGMIAITRAADGRGGATALDGPMMSALGITDIDEILRLAGSQPLSRAEMAALAPLVIAAARDGDAAATAILERGAAELALMASAVRSHLSLPDDVAITLTGGLTTDLHYGSMIRGAIAHLIPGARIVEPILPPLLGAALLALESSGIAPDGTIISHMNETYRTAIRSSRPS